MIKSDTIKIVRVDNFDNDYIEKQLIFVYSNIIRWAIIDLNEKDIIVSVSYNIN